jgi:putative FmdB family regulatory protein
MRAGYRRAAAILVAMPIYEYRCDKGHTFELLQAFSDEPAESCEVCGAPVHRVYHPVAVHFRGSGFYTTDYARKAKPEPASKDGQKKEAASASDASGPSESGSKKSGHDSKAKTSSGSDS